MSKPIRIFFSPLSNRFYASRAYKQTDLEHGSYVTITGDTFDVTDDIKAIVLSNNIVFKPLAVETDDRLLEPSTQTA